MDPPPLSFSHGRDGGVAAWATSASTSTSTQSHHATPSSSSSSSMPNQPYHAAGSASYASPPPIAPIPVPVPSITPSLGVDGLSLKGLTQRFYIWFKESGMLSQLQAQFRAQILAQMPRGHLMHAQAGGGIQDAMENLSLSRSERGQMHIMQRVLNSLIVDYLHSFNYPFTLSIFGPESGTRSEAGSGGSKLSMEEVLAILRIDVDSKMKGQRWIEQRVRKAFTQQQAIDEEKGEGDKENTRWAQSRHPSTTGGAMIKSAPNQSSVSNRFPRGSLLAILIDCIASEPAPPLTRDSGAQTDADPFLTRGEQSIESKLALIDKEYMDASIIEREMLLPTLQEKMSRFEREQNAKFTYELDQAKKRFRETELAAMKLEERARHRSEEDKLRKELRKEMAEAMERMRKEQEEVIERYQRKERETEEKLFKERQALQEHMNMLHSREMEIARKRDLMQQTQQLSESKIRESDRLLSTRSAELDSLAANLQSKLDEAKNSVRKEWEKQVQQRDEIIERLNESLQTVQKRLDRKTQELEESMKLMDEYEDEMKNRTNIHKQGDARLAELQQRLSLAEARATDLESSRAKLEERLLEASSKGQGCVHHVAELEALRQRLMHEEEMRQKLQQQHDEELMAERKRAHMTIQLAHAQATEALTQWKQSYAQLKDEMETHKAEEERVKQALEEEVIINRELKREIHQLRTGHSRRTSVTSIHPVPIPAPDEGIGAALQAAHSRASSIVHLPSSAFLAIPQSSSRARSPVQMFTASQPSRPSSQPLPSTTTATAPPTPSQDVTTTAAPASASASVSTSVADASSNVLDAEFFARQQALEVETHDLTHQLHMHAARMHVEAEVERSQKKKQSTVQAAADRHMEVTSAGRSLDQHVQVPASASSAPSSSVSAQGRAKEIESFLAQSAASAAAAQERLKREHELEEWRREEREKERQRKLREEEEEEKEKAAQAKREEEEEREAMRRRQQEKEQEEEVRRKAELAVERRLEEQRQRRLAMAMEREREEEQQRQRQQREQTDAAEQERQRQRQIQQQEQIAPAAAVETQPPATESTAPTSSDQAPSASVESAAVPLTDEATTTAPAAPAAETEWDEASTARYYAEQGGYYDENGQWIPYTMEQYEQYLASKQQQQTQDRATTIYAQQPYDQHAYDQQQYQQTAADAYAQQPYDQYAYDQQQQQYQQYDYYSQYDSDPYPSHGSDQSAPQQPDPYAYTYPSSTDAAPTTVAEATSDPNANAVTDPSTYTQLPQPQPEPQPEQQPQLHVQQPVEEVQDDIMSEESAEISAPSSELEF